jgi:hypothetical protein
MEVTKAPPLDPKAGFAPTEGQRRSGAPYLRPLPYRSPTKSTFSRWTRRLRAPDADARHVDDKAP